MSVCANYRDFCVNWCVECFEDERAKLETALIWQDESKVYLSEIFATVFYSALLMANSLNL